MEPACGFKTVKKRHIEAFYMPTSAKAEFIQEEKNVYLDVTL